MELEKCGVSLVVATPGRLLVASITPVNLLLESGSVGQRVGVILYSRLYCPASSGVNNDINSRDGKTTYGWCQRTVLCHSVIPRG